MTAASAITDAGRSTASNDVRRGVASSSAAPDDPVLSVRGLTVGYGGVEVIHDVDLTVHPGEIVVLLGASGSGKTTLLRALMGLVPEPGWVRATQHELRSGVRLVDLGAAGLAEWRRARSRHIGVVWQDASLALTPLRRVGSLLAEVLTLRGVAIDADGPSTRVDDALRAAGFDDPRSVARRRCCELSGGMAQRVGMALAIAGAPAVLLADEPTTALDGLARVRAVERFRSIAREQRTAIVAVTHDPHVAASLADRIAIVDDGQIADAGPARDVLVHSDHEVVVGVRCEGRAERERSRPGTERSETDRVLEAIGLGKAYPGTGPVLTDLNLEVNAGEIVGIVGRSGAGKSTLVRMVVALEAPDSGTIRLAGRDTRRTRGRELRRRVQFVPQDARASLNPWRRAWQLVADPLAAHRIGTRREHRERAVDLLERVGLAELSDNRPNELSTGQCQRVAIARAMAVTPELVVADEPVASLDAHLRADALTLLREMTTEHGTALVIVSHDLTSLELVCDRIAVLDNGRIVDDLPAGTLRDEATHPLTRNLVDCYPDDPLDHLATAEGTVP